jgi:hypothetical protein
MRRLGWVLVGVLAGCTVGDAEPEAVAARERTKVIVEVTTAAGAVSLRAEGCAANEARSPVT